MNIQGLSQYNPWWIKKDYNFSEKIFPYRDIYFQIEKYLENDFIISLIGLRRVGKSTIMKQLINKLISQNFNSKNILYFMFDDEGFVLNNKIIENVIETYFEDILTKKIFDLEDKIYIFFDEIQYVLNWQTILKKYYDLSNKKIKFIISGSQSILLKNKSYESLAGRILDIYISPLSFCEYLRLSDNNIQTFSIDLSDIQNSFFEINNFFVNYGKQISILAKDYLLSGQFPECISIVDTELKNKYILSSILNKIIEDLIKIYKIDKAEHLKILTYQFINNISSIFEFNNMAREIGTSIITLEKFVKYLENAYILNILYKDTKSIIKQGRTLKKAYVTSENFISAYNNFNSNHFDIYPEVFGKLIENAVYNQLKKHYNNISFWREEQKEIDFIVNINKKIIPLEVKFTNQIHSKDLSNLLIYLTKKEIDTGILITKNNLEKRKFNNKIIYLLPYYFLLMIRI